MTEASNIESSSYPFSFLKFNQEHEEMGTDKQPFELAEDYISGQLKFANKNGQREMLEKIIDECRQAEMGTYSNIRKGESLVKQLKIAAEMKLEEEI